MKDVMIDLETAGTAPGSIILTIGAVRFDREGCDLIAEGLDPLAMGEWRAFYSRIDIADSRAVGLTEDTGTMDWWARQSAAARHEAFDAGPRTDLRRALFDFFHWFNDGSEFIWSHGAGFDIVLLEAAAARIGLQPTWNFRNARDTRTLYEFTGVSPKRDGNQHQALFDALAQAEAVQRAWLLR